MGVYHAETKVFVQNLETTIRYEDSHPMDRERGESILHLKPPTISKRKQSFAKPPSKLGLTTRFVRHRPRRQLVSFHLRSAPPWCLRRQVRRRRMVRDHVDEPPVIGW
jgi:hypothetical protein